MGRVLLILSLLLCACVQKVDRSKIILSSEESPVQVTENYSMLHSDTQRIQVRIKAERIEAYINDKKDEIHFPKGFNLHRFIEGKEAGSLRCDYARQDRKEDKVYLEGDVQGMQGDTLQFFTESLVWDKKRRTFSSESYVRILRQNQVITGIGFTSDEDLTNWEIENPHGTTFKITATSRDTANGK